jgi:hypothetical protein
MRDLTSDELRLISGGLTISLGSLGNLTIDITDAVVVGKGGAGGSGGADGSAGGAGGTGKISSHAPILIIARP